MLTMTSKWSGFMNVIPARISENVYKSKVIARSNEREYFTLAGWIYMSPFTTWRANTFYTPSKFAAMIVPFNLRELTTSIRNLLSSYNIPIKQFISSTDRPNELSVPWPIKTCNEAAVTFKSKNFFVIRAIVNVNVIIVRSNCKLCILWIVEHNFDPLLRIFKLLNYFVEISTLCERYFSNTDPSTIICHS